MDTGDVLLIMQAMEREYREARHKAQDRTRSDSDRQYYFRKANHAKAILASLKDSFAGGWEKSA